MTLEVSWPNVPEPDKFVQHDLGFICDKEYDHMKQTYYIDIKTSRLYVLHTFKNEKIKDQWCEIEFRKVKE
jgi:hypothetical protein